MKITVSREDGSEEVYNDVSDYYLAVRQLHPLGVGDYLAGEYQTRSYSRGVNLRDIAKEIAQSLIELQAIMKEHSHASTT